MDDRGMAVAFGSSLTLALFVLAILKTNGCL